MLKHNDHTELKKTYSPNQQWQYNDILDIRGWEDCYNLEEPKWNTSLNYRLKPDKDNINVPVDSIDELTDEKIRNIWDGILPQGDPSGHKFSIAFAREIISAYKANIKPLTYEQRESIINANVWISAHGDHYLPDGIIIDVEKYYKIGEARPIKATEYLAVFL